MSSKKHTPSKNELQKKLDGKKRGLAECVEHMQRLQAEFENYKKRTVREKEDTVKYANERLILRLVEVADDFKRALKAGERSKSYDSLFEGLTLTSSKLDKILADEGVDEIKSVGEQFDPLLHDALLVEHSEDHSEDVIIEEVERGYTLKSKVIRPSKVKVCKKVK